MLPGEKAGLDVFMSAKEQQGANPLSGKMNTALSYVVHAFKREGGAE